MIVAILAENLIGKGGYAEVYKGCLRDGTLVAVKRLTKGTVDEKTCGFLCEIGIIAYVDHPNTAKLVGCDSDGIHLVFQLSPLGSLASILHGWLHDFASFLLFLGFFLIMSCISEALIITFPPGSKDKPDWSKRYRIALGTANGLTYLHEGCQKRIIHRDIKADNILLTEDYEPQVSFKFTAKNVQTVNLQSFLKFALFVVLFCEEIFFFYKAEWITSSSFFSVGLSI